MNPFRKIKEFQNLYRYWQHHPVAARDLNGTVMRFLRWQLGSRLLRNPVVCPWIGKTRLVVENGMTGATMNLYCGLHEFFDMAFLLHVLRPDDCFVDVGANVGSYTVLASGVCGARSLSIEPIPSTFERLSVNIAVNALSDRVTAECCGVGETEGKLAFICDHDTTNRVASEGYSGATMEVPIRTLNQLLSDFRAILWKVDVEGFEEAVLAGASEVLGSETLAAIEMEGDSPRIREVLESQGFRACSYDPFTREVRNADAEKNGHNNLWVRDLDLVRTRCKQALKMTVMGVEF